MPMKPKNDWFVYLHEDFCDQAAIAGLGDGAFRLHVTGLGWAASRRGDMLIPDRRVDRLTPYYEPAHLAELRLLGWWLPEPGGYRITESPYWMVCRDRENRKAIPRRTRAAVYERDGHRCVLCGTTDDLTLDHIHPYSRGGSDEPDNLRTLCRPCNSRKGARV